MRRSRTPPTGARRSCSSPASRGSARRGSLAEVERRAREAGARVLAGDCVDLGAGELPYLPLVAALRPLARHEDPALTDERAPPSRRCCRL